MYLASRWSLALEVISFKWKCDLAHRSLTPGNTPLANGERLMWLSTSFPSLLVVSFAISSREGLCDHKRPTRLKNQAKTSHCCLRRASPRSQVQIKARPTIVTTPSHRAPATAPRPFSAFSPLTISTFSKPLDAVMTGLDWPCHCLPLRFFAFWYCPGGL